MHQPDGDTKCPAEVCPGLGPGPGAVYVAPEQIDIHDILHHLGSGPEDRVGRGFGRDLTSVSKFIISLNRSCPPALMKSHPGLRSGSDQNMQVLASNG